MRVRTVLAAALALVGVGAVLALSQRDDGLVGTHFLPQVSPTVVVPPHATACQRATLLVGDSAAAQIVVATFGRSRPPMMATFRTADGQVVAHGVAPAAARDGSVTIPFAEGAVDDAQITTACVRNGGGRRIALSGVGADARTAARVDGRATDGVIAFRYFGASRETWWSLASVIAQRFGVGKASLFGAWTFPLLALALLGLWVAAVRLLVRETER